MVMPFRSGQYTAMHRLFLCLLLLAALIVVRPVAARDLGTTFAPGAHVRFEHVTIDDGLAQNAGLALLQDRRGYLWIGTQDGLNRYDGATFTTFRNQPDTPDSISYNSIIALAEDAQGYLWIGTWGGGLNRFDPQRSSFTRYQPDPANPASLSHATVTAIVPDDNGALWIGTLGGLDRFDPDTGTFTHFRSDPADSTTLNSNAISAILPSGDGKWWIGTGAFNTPGAGLNLFDPATGTAKHFPPTGPCLASPNISRILADSERKLWIAYGGYGVPGGGLDHFDPATGACDHYDNARTFDNQITDNNVTDLLLDRDGALWATSWSGGVWRMPPGQPGAPIHISNNPADPESLSSNSSYRLLQDRSGVLWISTLSAGINKLNLATLAFRTYKHDPSDPNSIANNHIGTFAEAPDGAIWVGTWESGLAHFDPATGIFRPYRNNPANPQSLSSDLVMSLHADSDGTLWVGTLGGGLNRRDPGADGFTRYRNDPADPASLLNDQVTTLFRDSAGRLWVGTFAGLSRLDPGARGFVNYPMSAPTMTFAEIGGRLWVGTWGAGVMQLDLHQPASLVPTDATFSSFTHDPTTSNSLSENSVESIHPTADGMIWLGTQNGLNRYDPQTGQFKVYREKDGLRNATIMGVLEDAQGFLWLTTNNGLAKFDPRTEAVRMYDKSDGLQGNEFNSNGYLRTSSGELYVGGVSGFSRFNPADLGRNEIPPPVVITSFAIFNRPTPFQSQDEQPIQLNYDQNFISFEFAALDYRDPRKNQYAYRMEGFDNAWIAAGTRSYASYTNLPGGSYTFRVRAANNDGVWNTDGVALRLIITPPFWQQWPFQLGSFLLIGAIISGGAQWRVYAVRAQNTQLQRMVDEQRRVEAELRESEARFRSMFDNAAVGVALMSLDRQVMQVNQATAHLTGYSAEELAGQNLSLLAVEEDRLIDQVWFQELAAGQRDQYVIEKRYTRKDGAIFWGRVNFAAVRRADGTPNYTIGMIEDITEERRSAERLATQEAAYRRMLEQRIAERTDELNLANELLREKAAQDAVTAERTRLARDLHDAVTQTLFSTTLIADVLPEIWAMNPDEGRRRLEEVRQMTRGALAEMRTLLVELRPNALIEVPLPSLLRQLSDALGGQAPIQIQFDSEGERKLPADVQIGLYRIAQEILNNVVKHAKATQAVVTLRLGETVRLTVADNGVGFDPFAVTADHLGLKIMRERAEAIAATLSVYSEPGEGTQISVVWP